MEDLSWSRIGERVRASRAAAGLSQQALADTVGLERSMVSKLESGDRRIDAVELTRIARALGVPVSHLLNPLPEVVSRRASIADSEDVGDSDAARSAYTTEVLLSEWLRDVRQLVQDGFLLPRPLLRYREKVSGPEDGGRAALWVRHELGLGTEPIDSVADASERAGQFVAVLALASDGASLVDGDIAVAVVGTDQAPGRRRSTAAHELGHMVLGDEFSSDLGVHASREEREKTVEAFAAEFLLPSSAVGAVAGESGEQARRLALVRVSATYRVSWSLAVTQYKRAASAPPDEVRRLRARTPTDVEFRDAVGWKPQPDLSSVLVPPRYASAVVAALRARAITPARAVEMLRGQVSAEQLTEEAAD
ncbi:XRE family transcriptional regulator [Streptomonospora sp. S1-112]|uniref:XRE family transcriptional regulator n=1 Tax=Streptomonospora mangrovi TaxID=2883123 RepID=A0A9X3NLL3_9ACTN|nr:XRE family transcriptional regulator [Streptomonospora mangrovi]MDA0564069.1 XRE family transcriptional regulator [Streptomonospora mangrovi]